MESPKSKTRKTAVILGIAGAAILLLVTGLVWFAWMPAPSIRFVEFRGKDRDAVAIFRVTNNSLMPVSFYGYDFRAPSFLPPGPPPNPGPPLALGAYRTLSAKGWDDDIISPCYAISKCHTLSGRSSTEVQVKMRLIPRGAPLALGIHFYRGSAAQISSAGYQNFLQRYYAARHYLKLPPPDYTWSDVSSAP